MLDDKLARVEWTEDLATGNSAIDQQHQYIFVVANELADAVNSHRTPAMLNAVMELLEHYVDWHFCAEERCMNILKCPRSEQNKAAHLEFRGRFLALRAEFRASDSPLEVARRLHQELLRWFTHHIKAIDTDIRTCAEEIPKTGLLGG